MLIRSGYRRVLRVTRMAALSLIGAALMGQTLAGQTQKQAVSSGKRYPRLVIRNAMVVDGNGTPTSGPKDIVIVGNTIAEVVPLDPVALREGRARRPEGDVEIDATGKYVLPGLINAPRSCSIRTRRNAAAGRLLFEALACVRHYDRPRRRKRYQTDAAASR